MKHSATPKPSTQLDLINISEADLLQNVADILMQPGPITPEQRGVLDAINTEFARRDALQLYPNSLHREIRVGG